MVKVFVSDPSDMYYEDGYDYLIEEDEEDGEEIELSQETIDQYYGDSRKAYRECQETMAKVLQAKRHTEWLIRDGIEKQSRADLLKGIKSLDPIYAKAQKAIGR